MMWKLTISWWQDVINYRLRPWLARVLWRYRGGRGNLQSVRIRGGSWSGRGGLRWTLFLGLWLNIIFIRGGSDRSRLGIFKNIHSFSSWSGSRRELGRRLILNEKRWRGELSIDLAHPQDVEVIADNIQELEIEMEPIDANGLCLPGKPHSIEHLAVENEVHLVVVTEVYHCPNFPMSPHRAPASSASEWEGDWTRCCARSPRPSAWWGRRSGHERHSSRVFRRGVPAYELLRESPSLSPKQSNSRRLTTAGWGVRRSASIRWHGSVMSWGRPSPPPGNRRFSFR